MTVKDGVSVFGFLVLFFKMEKMEVKIGEKIEKMEVRMEKMEVKMGEEMEKIGDKIDSLGGKLSKLDDRVRQIEIDIAPLKQLGAYIVASAAILGGLINFDKFFGKKE